MSDEVEGDKDARIAVVKKLERVYDGFFKMDRATVSHTRFDGGQQTIVRECLERGDAAAMLLLDPDKKLVWLVEQFRYPTLATGGGWIEELPAGIVRDIEEQAEESALRETAEETGFVVLGDSRIEKIAEFYVSPGGTSERIFLYLIEVDANQRGEPSPDSEEDILLKPISVDDFIAEARLGRLRDAKTLVAALWLAANRDRLSV